MATASPITLRSSAPAPCVVATSRPAPIPPKASQPGTSRPRRSVTVATINSTPITNVANDPGIGYLLMAA